MCEYVVKIEWHMHILSPVIKFNNADKFGKNMLGHWHKAVIKFADSQQDGHVAIAVLHLPHDDDDDVDDDAARKVRQVQWQLAAVAQGGEKYWKEKQLKQIVSIELNIHKELRYFLPSNSWNSIVIYIVQFKRA